MVPQVDTAPRGRPDGEMKMKKIMYLQGFASSGASGTVGLLRRELREKAGMACSATKTIRSSRRRRVLSSSGTIRGCPALFQADIA